MRLILTPTASEAVRRLVAAMDLPRQTGGLRIGRTDGSTFDMAIVDGPRAEDTRIDADGAQVFLAPRAAEFLDGRTLDAQFEAGRVRFTVVDLTAGDE